MNKRNKIIYWIATVWLSLGMVSTGVVQMLQIEEQVKPTTDMGYPIYFLSFLGVCKILGVLAVLVPRFPLLKEWAYAGFAFMMVGAIYAHLGFGQSVSETLPALLLLVLTFISWYFRPANCKLN